MREKDVKVGYEVCSSSSREFGGWHGSGMVVVDVLILMMGSGFVVLDHRLSLIPERAGHTFG